MIEERVERLLVGYARSIGRPFALPVPVEHIVEAFLDLQILWEPIERHDGREVLAKLQPFEKRIVYNETYLALFNDTPGLERTTMAHEAGHWDLHFDKSLLAQSALPGLEEPPTYAVCRDGAKTWQERHAHSYMSYLLMPRDLLLPLIAGVNLLNWPALYELREFLGVTITALTIRLQGLGVLYVGSGGTLHESKEVHDGQMSL